MSRYRKNNQLTIGSILKIGVFSSLLTLFLVGTCLLLLGGSFLGFLESLYSNRVVETVWSPDGKYQAITFFRCGMDWGDSRSCTTEASILKAGEVLRKADRGNIFIAEDDESFEDIQWLSEQKLLIVYKGYYYSKPTLQVHQKDDVEIEYQFVEAE